MGRRSTAIKGCPRCKKLVPTATRYCRCGFDFKKPPVAASGNAKKEEPKPTSQHTTHSPSGESSRRKSERRQRITVKPDFYSPSDYENPFKKTRRRTTSDHSQSDDGVIKRKRGRPRQVLSTGLVRKPTIKPIKEDASNDTNVQSNDSKDSKKEDKEAETDTYANIPPEKILQYTILLGEINRKISIQGFKPM